MHQQQGPPANAAKRSGSGILKGPRPEHLPPRPSTMTAASEAAKQAMADPLRGQKVIKDGQSAPIKPLHETIAALRLAKYDEAFESPLASTYLGSDTRSNPLLESPGRNDTNSAAAGGGGGGGGGSSSMRSSHKPSHIEVYFPIRFSKTQPHKASECGSLCNGQPHPDKGPVCRFCKKSIAQPHKDTHTLNILTALQHLDGGAGKCSLPDKERRLIFDGFNQVDKHMINELKNLRTSRNDTLPPKPYSDQAPRPRAPRTGLPRPSNPATMPQNKRNDDGKQGVSHSTSQSPAQSRGKTTAGGSNPAASRPRVPQPIAVKARVTAADANASEDEAPPRKTGKTSQSRPAEKQRPVADAASSSAPRSQAQPTVLQGWGLTSQAATAIDPYVDEEEIDELASELTASEDEIPVTVAASPSKPAFSSRSLGAATDKPTENSNISRKKAAESAATTVKTASASKTQSSTSKPSNVAASPYVPDSVAPNPASPSLWEEMYRLTNCKGPSDEKPTLGSTSTGPSNQPGPTTASEDIIMSEQTSALQRQSQNRIKGDKEEPSISVKAAATSRPLSKPGSPSVPPTSRGPAASASANTTSRQSSSTNTTRLPMSQTNLLYTSRNSQTAPNLAFLKNITAQDTARAASTSSDLFRRASPSPSPPLQEDPSFIRARTSDHEGNRRSPTPLEAHVQQAESPASEHLQPDYFFGENPVDTGANGAGPLGLSSSDSDRDRSPSVEFVDPIVAAAERKAAEEQAAVAAKASTKHGSNKLDHTTHDVSDTSIGAVQASEAEAEASNNTDQRAQESSDDEDIPLRLLTTSQSSRSTPTHSLDAMQPDIDVDESPRPSTKPKTSAKEKTKKRSGPVARKSAGGKAGWKSASKAPSKSSESRVSDDEDNRDSEGYMRGEGSSGEEDDVDCITVSAVPRNSRSVEVEESEDEVPGNGSKQGGGRSSAHKSFKRGRGPRSSVPVASSTAPSKSKVGKKSLESTRSKSSGPSSKRGKKKQKRQATPTVIPDSESDERFGRRTYVPPDEDEDIARTAGSDSDSSLPTIPTTKRRRSRGDTASVSAKRKRSPSPVIVRPRKEDASHDPDAPIPTTKRKKRIVELSEDDEEDGPPAVPKQREPTHEQLEEQQAVASPAADEDPFEATKPAKPTTTSTPFAPAYYQHAAVYGSDFASAPDVTHASSTVNGEQDFSGSLASFTDALAKGGITNMSDLRESIETPQDVEPFVDFFVQRIKDENLGKNLARQYKFKRALLDALFGSA